MNLLDFKNKLIKGKELGGDVVYIKEDNLLYGIESIYKNHEVNSISLLKSEQNSIKVHDLIEFLEKECDDFYEGDVLIGSNIQSRKENKNIGDSENGYNTKTTRKSKHTLLYEKEDNYIYKKPSEEQLRYASKL